MEFRVRHLWPWYSTFAGCRRHQTEDAGFIALTSWDQDPSCYSLQQHGKCRRWLPFQRCSSPLNESRNFVYCVCQLLNLKLRALATLQGSMSCRGALTSKSLRSHRSASTHVVSAKFLWGLRCVAGTLPSWRKQTPLLLRWRPMWPPSPTLCGIPGSCQGCFEIFAMSRAELRPFLGGSVERGH